jgi:short-subunit dehydrogenase
MSKRGRRDLRDMVVAISGASAGIGETLAKQLAERGAKLALCARRIEKLEALNQQLGGGHLIVRADVSKIEDCDAFIAATLGRFGRIDTLVCNAGYGMYKPAHEFTPQEMRDMFATNVFGTTDLIHAAIGPMLKQDVHADGWRGQIMIVSSAAARRAMPYLGPYSATKAAQLSLAEAMRVELKPAKIAVTSVHPIMTKTEFGQVAELAGQIKLPRGGDAFTQTVDHVAKRMVAAIEKPCAEVWPHRISRWVLGSATLMPRVVDRMMSKYRGKIEQENS